MNLHPPLRPVTPDDAPVLARLVDFAGEGMPTCSWAQIPGLANLCRTLVLPAPAARKARFPTGMP